jgi:flavin-dependent dehydrogenase
MAGENYDAIVIGSGPGGLSAATLLQKRGVNSPPPRCCKSAA